MNYWEKSSLSESVLILNRPNVITENNFYVDIFRIPEVLNRLRQYREILSEHDMNIPIWVYCLTQNIKSLMGSPQPFVLNFLVSLGLFDRYISKKGWPQYILGSDPLMSVLASEAAFEEQVLLLTNGYCQESTELQVYKAKSYYNNKTASFCLTNLKQKYRSQSLKKVLSFLKQNSMREEGLMELVFQLLSPHKEEFTDDLKLYGLFPREFLEWDQDLRWLWPIWKKTQMRVLRKKPVQMC